MLCHSPNKDYGKKTRQGLAVLLGDSVVSFCERSCEGALNQLKEWHVAILFDNLCIWSKIAFICEDV